ncbi:MAG: hypothetical protein BIFFINMI_03568 [Phycisphaerae bacterium]|nr:hypothetical protein [Phycisphaerae bacterium]
MHSHLTQSEYSDWVLYFQYHAFPDDLINAAQARITWAVLQSQCQERLSESDYLLKFRPPPTPEEYKEKAMRLYAMQNAARQQ